jgi:predicted P-loop ATPase
MIIMDNEQNPTREQFRAALGIAAPADDEALDLGLEMSPPRVVNGVIIPRRPKPTLRNLDRILRGDPLFAGTLRWNELKQAIMWRGIALQDHHVTELRLAVAERHDVEFNEKPTYEGLSLVARENSYHPVRDWLETLEWDGIERLDGWLQRWCGADDTPLYRAYGRKTLIAAVRRVYEPGCKVDTVLTLHGGQGVRKSTLIETLAHTSAWFSCGKIDWSSKEGAIVLNGVWLYEIAELAGKRKAEQETVKGFITTATDKYRPPYGRTIAEVPRSSVFFASTNEDTPLHDPTGNRRWWIVPVRASRIDLVKAEHEQVWAEAVAACRQGEPHYLDEEMEALREAANEVFEEQDPLLPRLAEYARGRQWFTAGDFWVAEEMPLSQLTGGIATRIGHMMKRLGSHDRHERHIGGVKVRGYLLR